LNIVIIFKEYSSNHKKIYSFLKWLGFELLFRAVNSNDIIKDEIEKINIIDFGQLEKLNAKVIWGDFENYIDRIVNRLVKKQSLKQFHKLFNGISNPDNKIKIYFRKYIGSEYESTVQLIHWLEQSQYSDFIIISMLDINRLGKEYVELSKLKIHHIPIINKDKLFVIKKSIIGIIQFFYNYSKIKVKSKQKKKKNDNIDLKIFKVMFFPHKSIFYGDLFLKDHFYSENSSSLFHPKNIIHLEYEDVDIDKEKTKYKKCFGFEPILMNLSNLTRNKEQIYLALFKCIDKELIRFIIKEKISFLTLQIMSILYYAYLYYYYAIQEFNNVKIALVGYDILFPVGLSLALETRGIKTISVQDRFICSFLNDSHYIIDTQFIASNYISSLSQSKQECISVNNYIPTGLIRTDKLKKLKNKSSRRKVLVFDYHIENDFNYQISDPFINWTNDRFFRKELTKLAKDFKDYDFIIRGKNNEWTKISYFNDILNDWNKIPNISIDSDYSELYHSYKLCNDSDLIIARYSSIADECISKGYDVIIFDYGINYNRLVRDYYPMMDGINFCHSYQEIKAYMNFFHKNGFITNPKLKNEIINTLFDGLCDGNVQNRIQQHLNEIITE